MVRHLQISDAQASSTATMAQVSYGLGCLFRAAGRYAGAPLPGSDADDMAACGMLFRVSAAWQAVLRCWLFAARWMAGVFSVAAQVLVPMAATFAALAPAAAL